MKEKEKDIQYGAITEQSDLGLGFDIFNESDQESLKKIIKERISNYDLYDTKKIIK